MATQTTNTQTSQDVQDNEEINQMLLRAQKSFNDNIDDVANSNKEKFELFEIVFNAAFKPNLYGSQWIGDIVNCYSEIIKDYLLGVNIIDWDGFDNCNLMRAITYRYGYVGLLIIIHYLLKDPNRKRYNFKLLFDETVRGIKNTPSISMTGGMKFTRDIFRSGINPESFFKLPVIRTATSSGDGKITVDDFFNGTNNIFMDGGDDTSSRYDYYNDFIVQDNVDDITIMSQRDELLNVIPKEDIDTEFSNLFYDHLRNTILLQLNEKNFYKPTAYQLMLERILLDEGIAGVVRILQELTKHPENIDQYVAKTKKEPSAELTLLDLLDNNTYNVRKKSLNLDTLFAYGFTNKALEAQFFEIARKLGGQLFEDYLKGKLQSKDGGKDYFITPQALKDVKNLLERMEDNILNYTRLRIRENKDGLIGVLRQEGVLEATIGSNSKTMNGQGATNCTIMRILYDTIKK